MSQWVNEWMNEWMNGMSEWVNEWMEWVSEWMNEWMNEWMTQSINHQFRVSIKQDWPSNKESQQNMVKSHNKLELQQSWKKAI